MDNPCTRDCPDRYPGCDCEKRKAWKWNQEQLKEAKRRDNIVRSYRRDKIRSCRRQHKRFYWDQ